MPDTTRTKSPFSLGCALFILVALALICGAEAMFLRDFLRAPEPTYPVLQTKRDLPAFAAIGAGDFKSAFVHEEPDAASIISLDLISRVTAAALPAGTTLTEANTVAVPAGWHIIAAPISPTLALQPGETLIVLGVEKDDQESGVISEQALALGRDGGLVGLALPANEAANAAAYLAGDRSLILIRPTDGNR